MHNKKDKPYFNINSGRSENFFITFKKAASKNDNNTENDVKASLKEFKISKKSCKIDCNFSLIYSKIFCIQSFIKFKFLVIIINNWKVLITQ